MKKILKSTLIMVCVLLSWVNVYATAANNACDGIGKVQVSTIPLPSEVIMRSGSWHSATYTYSGKVLIAYKTTSDMDTSHYVNLAIINDDGTGFKKIFSGVIQQNPLSNGGYRFMPFEDKKRILLGDYVLECSPNIDDCESTKLVPVVFPEIIDADPMTMCHWSEVIIAPDNKHMAWTLLRKNFTAAALVGTLTRYTDQYVIENAQIISVLHGFENDPANPCYLIPSSLRGGEVKQFVKGGNAISVVGAMKYATTDSMVQDLNSTNLTQITYTPGYDETTIFSPDECLGITMSTRFSSNTDPQIFGIMPRPYAVNTGVCSAEYLYTYSVTGVRTSRVGNIGPALININFSKSQAGYKGINLNTDPNWVFYSPMSWNPDGKRAMWLEGYRGTGTPLRLQKVTLLDYCPKRPVPIVTTPDNISYSIKDLSLLSTMTKNVQGIVTGKRSGSINYISSEVNPYVGTTEAQYVNFSDDGVNFYNGYEKINYVFYSETRYEANLKLTGIIPGEMNFRATFGPIGTAPEAKLIFDTDPADGKPKSYGYVKYNGVTLNVSDLIP